MKRYHLVFIFLLSLAENAFGQSAALFFQSADIGNARTDSSIRDVWPQKFGKYMRIKYTNGDKTKILKDSVWGFRSRKGRLYRMYKGEPYQFVVKDGYIKYYYDTFALTEPTIIPVTEARYSATLDSPIVFSKKKARRK
ncbi:hypothetical protein [Dyadobacter psychrophilus]|uniref:MORN repeat variant n=1 Tax=Dyadobacter psychrophilus TaxID=651661 RepID=A0A1T5HEX4_9BACT|nr:hypothetical protein [Dyadobacter psychrophilus]SKC19071.1 hypothetical protein SAMN05660293_05420 [Dyadobacter psychrophilus]